MICPGCQREHSGPGSHCANCLLHPPRSARAKSPQRRKPRQHDPAPPTSISSIPSPEEQESQYTRIIATLRANGPMTRREIFEKTGIGYETVTPRVLELADAGRVVLGRTVRNKGTGRSARLVMLPHGRALVEDPQQSLALEDQ